MFIVNVLVFIKISDLTNYLILLDLIQIHSINLQQEESPENRSLTYSSKSRIFLMFCQYVL